MALRIIAIYPCLNGYICEVGCQKVVFNSRSHLLDSLRRYLDDPHQVEKEFINSAVNPMVPEVALAHAPPPQPEPSYSGAAVTTPPPTQYVGPLHTGR